MTKLYILAGVLFFVGLIVKSPWFKGWIGELQVNMAARFFLDKRLYHLVKNVTLPTTDGTTQIDHVIVSPYGVFVVETKNLRGWIFGSEREEYWTQKIFKHTNRFQNPLRQNYKHTRTLAELLDLAPEKVKSVIVFVGDSDFKTPMPENVTYAGGYMRCADSTAHIQQAGSEPGETILGMLPVPPVPGHRPTAVISRITAQLPVRPAVGIDRQCSSHPLGR